MFLILIPLCLSYVIIDHTHVDLVDNVPDSVFNTSYHTFKLHYAHTSHGSQLVSGSSYLEDLNDRYTLYKSSNNDPATLPNGSPPGIRYYDGMPGNTYVTPEQYWNSEAGRTDVGDVLDTGLFTHTMWSFCGQMASNEGPTYGTSYTTQISALEALYPNVVFIYMTGHLAGSSEYAYSDSQRENLRLNNEHVRNFVKENNKILYDFADIESYNGDVMCVTNSLLENYNNYPVECDWPSTPSFSCSHTVGYNCEKKAKAFWYLVATLTTNQDFNDNNDDADSTSFLTLGFLLLSFILLL